MMQRGPHTRALWLALGLITLLLTAGCFQPAGSGSEFGDFVPQPTFTPFIEPTPEIVVAPTDTPDFAPLTTDTPQPEATQIALVPTNTPFFVPTTTPVGIDNSDAINALLTPQGTEVADASFQDDNPFALTATFIVGQATLQAAIPLTQTQEAILGIPTATSIFGQPTLAPTLAPGVPGGTCQHVVQATDRNLYRISLQYNTTVEAIASASGITNINLITVGQVLTIPNCGGSVSPPVTTVPGGTGCARSHVVRQNETLFQISLQYGVTVHDIAACSGVSNINLIYIGQQLSLP